MPSDNRYDLLRDSILETLGVPEDSALRAGPADKASAPADEPPRAGRPCPDSTSARSSQPDETIPSLRGAMLDERASVFIADDGELLGVGLSNTLSERGSRYGDFTENAFISQHLKNVMATYKGWDHLSPVQREALTMIAQKIARILNGDPNYKDNWHDIQGYARLAEERCREK